MKKTDNSQRFLFEKYPIRGQHVSLDESWREIAQQSDLQGRASELLGEALVVVSLLVDTLKIAGSITLQIRGAGPLGLLVVEASSEHTIRGTAQQSGTIEEGMDLQQIFGSNHLVITIRTEGAEPYQGLAPLQGKNLAAALENYFATSEQSATHFWLACDGENASGMLIQRLPGELKCSDTWNRIIHLMSTITRDELQQLPLDTLLHRLFHDDLLRLFDPHKIRFHCSCSRGRTAKMLLSLSRAEVDDILEQEGEVTVNCEFCSSSYRFDAIDVEQVFRSGGSASNTTH